MSQVLVMLRVLTSIGIRVRVKYLPINTYEYPRVREPIVAMASA
jgi:hypothetical protein